MVEEIERIALLPVRIGLRATRIALKPASAVAWRLLNQLQHQEDRLREDEPAPSERVERPPSTWRPAPPAAPPAVVDTPPVDYSEPAPVEPEHVSEEPVLVDVSADEGAEESVGASISIAEPWDGYRQMKAAEVIARIESASREELAVIELYEGMNRRRSSVLEAAERQLKAASPPSTR